MFCLVTILSCGGSKQEPASVASTRSSEPTTFPFRPFRPDATFPDVQVVVAQMKLAYDLALDSLNDGHHEEAFDRFELLAFHGDRIANRHVPDTAFAARHARSHIHLAFLKLAGVAQHRIARPDPITSAAHNLCRASRISAVTYSQALTDRALSADARAAIEKSTGDYMRCTGCMIPDSSRDEPTFPVVTWSGDCDPPTPEQFLLDLRLNFERAVAPLAQADEFKARRRLAWLVRQCNSFIHGRPDHDREIDRYRARTETELALATLHIGQTDPDPVGEAAYNLCRAARIDADGYAEALARHELSPRAREAAERAQAMVLGAYCRPTSRMIDDSDPAQPLYD
jgi:hypothetical protein